nr:sensor domain-containing diguanylate cyclase [Shewanella sp. 1CM18E]
MINLSFLCSFILISISTFAQADESNSNLSNTSLSLVVANSKAWKPFSYIDDNGQPSGLLIDLWNEFGNANHIQITFLLTDWEESIDLVRQGKADVHAGLLWSSQRSAFFDFGNNLAKLDGQLFVNKSLLNLDVSTIIETETLGVIKGSYEDTFIQAAYPDAKLERFDNNEQMVSAALKNKINVFIADFQVANFYLYTAKQQNAFSPIQHLYTASVKPAVAKGNSHLLDFIKSGFNKVDSATFDRVQRKWLHVETVYPNYLLPLMVLTALSMVSFYVFQLKRTVSHRTRELNKANEELKLLAGSDPLTGIANRRFYMNELEQQMPSKKGSLTLLIFDVDKFKAVNDEYGHHIGDQVLQAVVYRVNSVLNSRATFGRIGGEEFSIFDVGLSLSQAKCLATQIQNHISATKFQTDIGEIAISVSLGGVHSEALCVGSSTLMQQADLLMYKAKQQGRNRCEFEIVKTAQ